MITSIVFDELNTLYDDSAIKNAKVLLTKKFCDRYKVTKDNFNHFYERTSGKTFDRLIETADKLKVTIEWDFLNKLVSEYDDFIKENHKYFPGVVSLFEELGKSYNVKKLKEASKNDLKPFKSLLVSNNHRMLREAKNKGILTCWSKQSKKVKSRLPYVDVEIDDVRSIPRVLEKLNRN